MPGTTSNYGLRRPNPLTLGNPGGAARVASDLDNLAADVDSLIPKAVGPRLIVPPGAVFAASTVAAWYAANAATFMRFHVPVTKNYRYVNLRVGTASGNIQVGVASVALSSSTVINVTRVMHSGVIACPAAGSVQVDCGDTALPAGDYVLFLWCDNTTATFPHSLAADVISSRMLWTATGLASGLGSGVQSLALTTRWVTGLTLESAT